MTTVLKLGGSVVTEKENSETIDQESLDELAGTIAEGGLDDLIIVHGGGSFGHPNAKNHGVSTQDGSHEWVAVAEIHDAMVELNRLVLASLREHGVPAVGVDPFSAAFRDADDQLSLYMAQVDALLGEGFVPVLHGDVVAHEGKGVTIVSGDELVVELADGLGADRVGVCSAVPGVLDEAGNVVGHIGSYDEVADAVGGSDATDVTGGMAGKVRELLSLSAPAFVFDRSGVGPFLAGESPGTRIE